MSYYFMEFKIIENEMFIYSLVKNAFETNKKTMRIMFQVRNKLQNHVTNFKILLKLYY